MTGWQALLYKEVLRFWKVGLQTVAVPVFSALLYLLIFGQVLQEHVQPRPGVSYIAFLAPGLVMMSVLQSAFANSSSSLIQNKITGGLVFLQLAPISPLGWFAAYVGAAVLRALAVGAGVGLAAWLFAPFDLAQPLWALAFALCGAAMMGALGLIAGLWAEKFDQMAAFQSFFIMPLTMLGGVFYSVHSLPAPWRQISRMNPFFYMIDGFRHGLIGAGEVAPWLGLGVTAAAAAACGLLALALLRSGYKLRS